MKRGKTIRREILKAFFGVSILGLAIFAGVSLWCNHYIREVAVRGDERIIEQSSASSERRLLDFAGESTMELVISKAHSIDHMIAAEIGNVEEIAAMVEYLHDAPPDAIPLPEEELSDMEVFCSSDIDWTVLDSFRIYNHLHPLLETVFARSESVYAIYLGTPEGVLVYYNGKPKGHGTHADPRERMWFTEAVAKGGSNVSSPYIDAFSKELTVTVSAPCRSRTDGSLIGVVGADYKVEALYEHIIRTHVRDDSYAIMLSDDGRIVTAPDLTPEKETAPELYLGENTAGIATIGSAENGMFTTRLDGALRYVFWARMETTGWSLAIVRPEDSIVGGARESAERIREIGRDTAAQTAAGFRRMGVDMGVAAALILLLVLAFSVEVSRRISQPIKKLSSDLARVGVNDNWDYRSDIRTGDEIEELSRSFELMTGKLATYIEHLTKITADKEKIEGELKAARTIQMGILPRILPPFPKCESFEVDARLRPAKEVGGDLYDFFMLSPDKLCFVVGDVSGKGVPASLLMAVTQTLHRGMSRNGASPAELVRDMNQALCTSNSAGMFVTYCFCNLDLASGVLRYCSAGHNPFFVLRRGGAVETSQLKPHGIPLGVRPNREYGEGRIALEVGDAVFLYTDGVTEAKSRNGEFFGAERLKKTLEEVAKEEKFAARTVTTKVRRAIDEFTGDAEQFDDITFLCVKLVELSDQELVSAGAALHNLP